MTLANTYNTDKVDGTKDTDSTENTHNTDDVDSIQTISKELSLWGLAAQHVLPACGQLFPEWKFFLVGAAQHFIDACFSSASFPRQSFPCAGFVQSHSAFHQNSKLWEFKYQENCMWQAHIYPCVLKAILCVYML